MPTFMAGFKCPPQHGGEEQARSTALGELAIDVLAGESSPLYARLYSQGLLHTIITGDQRAAGLGKDFLRQTQHFVAVHVAHHHKTHIGGGIEGLVAVYRVCAVIWRMLSTLPAMGVRAGLW